MTDSDALLRRGYRADIDGLRAIAVSAVIMMHAGISSVTGGFLGVDVFFVISGYLIHKDLTFRIQAGTYSALAFYGRRMRRTLPALYLMAITSLGVAALLFMPGDFDLMARSVTAAALAVSNILFLNEAGYFDHDAIIKPLLHTWTLGVEAQFYLIAPLLPYCLSGLSGRFRKATLLGLFIVGLLFCIALQTSVPAAAFFLMPARIWEFLTGCIIADCVIPTIRRQWLAEVISGSALAALIGALVLTSEVSAHPGLPTLIPCLATAALIHTGTSTHTIVGKLLSARILTFVGLISYSLYLWHWPLIVFARYLEMPMTPVFQMAGGGLLLAVSTICWKYVEQPFRDPAAPIRRQALPVLSTSLAVLLLSSAAVVLAAGVPERFPAGVRTIASYYDYKDRREFREGTCFITSKFGSARYFDRNTCLKESSTRPNYLLIGDSHAAHLWIGLSTVFTDLNIMQATASGCKPFLNASGKDYCVDLMHYALVDFLPTAKIDSVIFSAAWNESDASQLASVVKYSEKFVSKVVVLGRIPVHDIDLPNLISRSLVENRPDIILEHQLNYPQRVDAYLREFVNRSDYISLFDLLCPENKCTVYASNSSPIQFDKSHLTTDGSIFVARLLRQMGAFLNTKTPDNPSVPQ